MGTHENDTIEVVMTDESLADRLLNYSDAIAAATFLGVSAMGIAMSESDIRCEFARVPASIALGNMMLGASLTMILLRLRKWELDLRTESAPSEKAVRYGRILHVSRLLIIWLSALVTIGLVFVATRDNKCEVILGALAS